MEGLINFVIILIIILAVLGRVKKAGQDAQKKGLFAGLAKGMVVPPSRSALNAAVLGVSSQNLDKIVKVYGTGALLGTDEVSILLNVSSETAQRYLEQLALTGQAVPAAGAGGKMRYKLK